VIPWGDMHQSFTDALVKWFFDNFPVFADSFISERPSDVCRLSVCLSSVCNARAPYSGG